MAEIYKPRFWQRKCLEIAKNHKKYGFFLDMGLGKTAIMLTHINWLLNYDLAIKKTLIIAPKMVALNVWKQEAEKWKHTNKLTFSIIDGTQLQRKDAVNADADIYVLGRDNVKWFVDTFHNSKKFDALIIDESSSFKSHKSARFKSLKRICRAFEYTYLLTGTPIPNGYMDLWTQIYMLDYGKALGTTISAYRRQFFMPDKMNGSVVYNYKLRDCKAENDIKERIKGLCLSIKTKDVIKEQAPTLIDKPFYLSDKNKKSFDEFKKEQILQYENEELIAVNAAALYGKLLQFSNGTVYNADGKAITIHNEKLDFLHEVIEECDGNILLTYQYKHDLERLNSSLREYKPRVIKDQKSIKDWNKGKIKIGLVHPKSVSYGLNLQFGGNYIIWFGLDTSLEKYMQLNARLPREGQQNQVYIIRIYARGTYDEKVLAGWDSKKETQESLIEALKKEFKKYENYYPSKPIR